MRKPHYVSAAVTAVLVVAIVAVALDGTGGSSRTSDQVAVFESYEDTAPRYFETAVEAEERAGAVAGFDPLLPAYLPDGYRVTLIGVSTARPDYAFRRVTVEARGPTEGEWFKLIVANEPFGFAGDEPENAIDRPSPNSRLYRHPDDEHGISFTLITASRGIYASSPPGGVSPDELRKVLLSYPLD